MDFSKRSRSYLHFGVKFFLLGIVFLSLGSCKSTKISKDDPVFNVISTAKSFTGTPYKFGGTTRAGMDCSALIYHAYYSVGVTMPRISADQARMGKKVSPAALRPGDVLFFATSRKRNRVTHAGIVTEIQRGDIRFIHASTSLGVTEDFLSNRYWNKAFLFGRRILQ